MPTNYIFIVYLFDAINLLKKFIKLEMSNSPKFLKQLKRIESKKCPFPTFPLGAETARAEAGRMWYGQPQPMGHHALVILSEPVSWR
jgi:hypothetical protein